MRFPAVICFKHFLSVTDESGGLSRAASTMSSTSKRTKGKNLATSRSAKLGKWEVTDSTVVRLEMKSDYCSDEFRVSARQAWSSLEADGKSEIDLEGGAVVIKSPFNCFCLPQLLANQGFVQQLKENLLQLKFNDKSNDLYKFRQSEDLKSIGNSTITAIRKFLYQDFRLWLSGVTGIELDETIDMSCSQYDKTGIELLMFTGTHSLLSS